MSLNIIIPAEHIDRKVIHFHQNSEQVKKGISFSVGHTDMYDYLFLEISPDFTKKKKKIQPITGTHTPGRVAGHGWYSTRQAEQWVFPILMFLTEIWDM